MTNSLMWDWSLAGAGRLYWAVYYNITNHYSGAWTVHPVYSATRLLVTCDSWLHVPSTKLQATPDRTRIELNITSCETYVF